MINQASRCGYFTVWRDNQSAGVMTLEICDRLYPLLKLQGAIVLALLRKLTRNFASGTQFSQLIVKALPLQDCEGVARILRSQSSPGVAGSVRDRQAFSPEIWRIGGACLVWQDELWKYVDDSTGSLCLRVVFSGFHDGPWG